MSSHHFSAPEELNRIVKLFEGCQEFDDFESAVQSVEEKWKDKLNNAAEYRLCRMRYDQGFYPVAVPESVINNLHSIRLKDRVTNILQNECIVVRITNRQSTNSPIADGVIEGRYSNEGKYNMKSKSSLEKIMRRKPLNFRVCELQLDGSQQGWGIPLEATDDLEKVELKGRTNCGRACVGDTVLVEVLEKDEDNSRLGHGRVVGVLKQHEKLRYKLFVCEIIYDQHSTFMRPLCHSFPKIGYDNRFARDWYRDKFEKSVSRNPGFQSRRATGVQNRDERMMENIEKFANANFVSVYNPRKRLVEANEEKTQQKKKKDLQQPKQSRTKTRFEFSPYDKPLRVQKHNCENLFIVCYLGWSVDQFYPSGKVVHVFNRVDRIESTLEVLLLKHALPTKVIETYPVKQDLERVHNLATDTSDHAKRRDFRSHFTITIDNPDTKDMDDAISFQYDVQTRVATVGVHITDVSYYVTKDSPLDRLGRNRVVTIYPPKIAKLNGSTPHHLFPSLLSEALLSLVEGQDRRCLSTIFEFKRDPTGEWDLRRKTPAMTLIRSNRRLNKEDVHDILLGKVSEANYSDELVSTIRHLWGIAKELRIYRMGPAAFVLRDKFKEADEIGYKFEASALVEEFMVLANRTVGEFLATSKYLEPFAIRVQDPPREVDVELWRSKFDATVLNSAEIARHFRNLSIRLDPRTLQQNVLVFKDDARLLKQLCFTDPRGAVLMLFAETRFPHLFLAIKDWHRISRPASYLEFCPQQKNLHFDLNIENYVHFTSPLRRYPDVLVHRSLRAQLEAQIQGKVEPIQELVDHMNRVVQRNKRFQKDCQCFEFAELNKTKPQCFLCVIKEISDDAVVFSSPSSEFLPSMSNTMPLRFFSLTDRPAISGSVIRLRWKKKIFCHPSSERWNTFIAEGLEPGKKSEVAITSLNYVECVAARKSVILKEQLIKCQGNYDEVRQNCIRSANEILCGIDYQSGCFFVSSESKMQHHFMIGNNSYIVKDVELGDVMKVQYYNIFCSGILTPTIQMIELCETVDMCVAHRMRPVASFERTAQERCPTSNEYRDFEHYARVWLPIVAMESASVAAAADDSVVIHDVELLWKYDQKNNRQLGMFCLTDTYCQNRQIRFSDSVYLDPNRKEKLAEHQYSASPLDPAEEAFGIAESMKTLRYAEYICLRSKQGSHTWIGHGGIVAVYISPHTKSVLCGAERIHVCRCVVFHLNEVSCDSAKPQESLTRATVEVIYKFLPSRRQEIAIQMLGDVGDTSIASSLICMEDAPTRRDQVGDWTIYLQKLQQNNIYSFQIRYPSDTGTKKWETIPCNDSQNSAIQSALTKPVTLIWGPPGTGKTSTGVMLTYWYVFINRSIDDTWSEAEDYFDESDEEEDEIEEVDAADAHVAINYSQLGLFRTPNLTPGQKQRPREVKIPKSKKAEVRSSKSKDPRKEKLQTRRQVLYCGPSNASVDVVAVYLKERLKIRCPKIVRVASEQIELRKYPVPGEGQKSKVNAETQISPQLEQITLHEVVRIGNGKRARLLKSFDWLFRRFLASDKQTAGTFSRILLNTLPEYRDLQRYLESYLVEYQLLKDPERNDPLQVWDMDLSFVTRLYRSLLSDAKSIALQKFEVILCTTSVSSSGLLQNACKFCQIIIDEAGMCTQPETLVPIVGYLRAATTSMTDEDGMSVAPSRLGSHHAERVVLIGDHKQLCPIIQNKIAELLGLRKSFMECGSRNMVMLKYQYRMHPSLADFPAEYFYNVDNAGERGIGDGKAGLQTRASPSWTGIGLRLVRRTPGRYWNGINTHLLAEDGAFQQMGAVNANVLHGSWPGVRTRQRCKEQGYVYSTLPDARLEELHAMGEEERIVFLNIVGKEKRTTVASEEGHEDSRCNELEAATVVRIYKSIVDRLHSRRLTESTIGVLSQYRYQVSIIKRMLQHEGFQNPTVQTVIASQGSEFDYVILSLVRSLPDYEIPAFPLPGWENKYLGFITDENQINVALTRARRGLIIIGNRNLLRTNRMWSCLLDRLEQRHCIPAQPDDFPDRTGDRRPISRCAGHPMLHAQHQQFSWRDEQQAFWPVGVPELKDWAPRIDFHHHQQQQQWPGEAAGAFGEAAAGGGFQARPGVGRSAAGRGRGGGFKTFSNEDFPALR